MPRILHFKSEKEKRAFIDAAATNPEAAFRPFNRNQWPTIIEWLKHEVEKRGLSTVQIPDNPADFAYKYSSGVVEKAAHSDFLSKRLATAYRTGGSLLVSMPPRHGKTTLAVEWFTLWVLTQDPTAKIIFASYEADYAAEWGGKIRQRVIDLGAELGIKLDMKQASRNNWRLISGGGITTAGVGGPLTGRGANILLCDDLLKNEIEASSEVTRERTDNWFQTVALTRLEPGACLVCIGTKWHEDDILSRLTKRSNGGEGRLFEIINLPALAEKDDPLGRSEGAALWPSRFPLSTLELTKRSMTSYNWSALYQQRPSPEGGGKIKDIWWRFTTPEATPPVFDQMLQSWDLSLKIGKGRDPVVGQVWGRQGASYYLLSQVRGEFDLPTVIEHVRLFTKRYPQATLKLIEDKAAGPALMQMLRRETPGVVGVNPTKSKEARVEAVLPLIEAGNVYLPKNTDGTMQRWVDDFISECRVFPQGKHDDMVDAMSQALTRLMPAGWRSQDLAHGQANVEGVKPLTYKEQFNAAFHEGTREAIKAFEDGQQESARGGAAYDPYFGEW